MKSWQGILFGILFVVVGVALLIYAVKTISSYNEKNETYQEIIGRVVDYDYDTEGLMALIVEYQVNGNTYRKISNEYSDNPRTIGSEVSLKYTLITQKMLFGLMIVQMLFCRCLEVYLL